MREEHSEAFQQPRETFRPREVIAKGSKSFFLASLFFGRRERRGAWDLYSWCRHCDDTIDAADERALSTQHISQLEPYRRLVRLRQETGAALTGPETAVPGFEGLARLAREFHVPSKYPYELLSGFELDVRGQRYESAQDLLRYAYHVAGVVGVMMCFVMGVSDARALGNAIDLGNAMQLTNIARDVREDAELGRVYLPLAWLREAGVAADQLLEISHAEAVHAVRLRLLDFADGLYESGYDGLKYLPLRAAIAVSVAGSVYSAIGRKIREGGVAHLYQRTTLSFWEKLGPVAQGLLRLVPLAVKRVVRPWRPVSLAGFGRI